MRPARVFLLAALAANVSLPSAAQTPRDEPPPRPALDTLVQETPRTPVPRDATPGAPARPAPATPSRLPETSSSTLVRLEGGGVIDEETVRTARETASHSTGTPEWTNTPGFEKDVFVFARIIFRSNFTRFGFGGRTGWVNDYPDSDLNLSWRLQQLTALRVDPDTRVLKLTHADLPAFPFIYMVKPGRMELAELEVLALRKYLLNGGSLLIDDTWGRDEWQNVERQLARVLPNRPWSELPREHPVFHCVFKLDRDKLQIPPIQRWSRSRASNRGTEDTEQAYFRAWHDDRGRLMALAAHNTDLGDGWEREGENDEYFHTFSEPRAYPMAVNIVFYFMTH